MPDRFGPAPAPDYLMKHAAALVVEALEQPRRDRRKPQSETRKAMQHVGGGAAHDWSSRRGDLANVEVEPAVSPHEQRESRQAIGLPAERRVELRRRVEARLIGLDDPQQTVTVDRALSFDPGLVAHDRR